MPRYIVTEVLKYEYDAENEEDAERLCKEDANRDEKCVGVADRYAELETEATW